MHDLMLGMFWGGFLMAIPPVAIGVAISVMLIRHEREGRAAERRERSGD